MDDGLKGSNLIALNIEAKYRFATPDGVLFHEYLLPSTPEIQNCGGYVDKVLKYRAPSLREHFRKSGVTAGALADERFPILQTRSGQLDLLIWELIKQRLQQVPGSAISLFDHGCSAGEHIDLLDAMLQADPGVRASEVLNYTGLDISPLLLNAAKLLHADFPDGRFRLLQSEGAAFDLPPASVDIALSVGVINHCASPLVALTKLIAGARCATVVSIWVTSEPAGFWAFNHNGIPNYFFSAADLKFARGATGQGRYLVAAYVPESMSTQKKSYVGIGAERERHLGSYHLLYDAAGSLSLDLPNLQL